MIDVLTILLAISLIIFFGFFAEFIFKKIGIPDVLLLTILGFVIGPNLLKYISPDNLMGIAPAFTTFTLLFLLFDGAFNIHLASLIKELSESLKLTLFNFFISSLIITLVVFLIGLFWIEGISFLESLLTGFILGGISSSFVIPILKQVNISEKVYSLLTLESALTDVFCIVFSLTVIEIFKLGGGIGIQSMVAQLAALFAVAGLIGLTAGIIWIVLSIKVFKESNYMVTIAYLLLMFAVTELLQGNGAIAALFFGLMLKNSRQLTSILRGVTSKGAKAKKKAIQGRLGTSVITPSEEFFYHQISFFLKTFFFVYIGVLIDISDWKALVIGGIISVLVLISRNSSSLLTRGMEPQNRTLINSVFARGLAAAAIAQVAVQSGVIPYADFIAKITYVVITGTILLSSVRVFFAKRLLPAKVEIKKQKV